ncbi:FecR family protein [Chitinophaga qingshengii]|uniref:FecR domain-containing protein n=1 Tax=Chitinophaga qingshengii TaxID=1569794 RepID=A0ABR7THM3_9BACT|nr:FecR domain-containing protein [Chitinophaga qingshengii]MBC9930002.1 FecR domain-containing protein [Chitinophaga qingshengii]
MYHSAEQFLQLTDKYLADTITAREKGVLFSMIARGAYIPEQEQIVARIWQQPLTAAEDITMREQIIGGISARRKKVRRLKIWRWTAAAAVLVLIGAAGSMRLWREEHRLVSLQQRAGKVVLVLGDESQVPLGNSGNLVINEGGARIVQQGAELRYTAGHPALGRPIYNTLRTAAGGQLKLVLPDGTRVWINAGSTVRYPVRFFGNKRQIEVTGEVYMEVEPEKRPFLVSTPHETVQVLGTAFNVHAYNEESFTATTLVSGKIRIVNNYQAAVTLHPGQQARVNHQPVSEAVVRVAEADIEHVVAWKNGYFDFDNETLDDIFRLLSRWYDVQFEAEDSVSRLQFSATINRAVTLEEALSILSSTGAVDFFREGNIIRARMPQ